MKKRIMSVMLTIAMVVSLMTAMTFTASAAEPDGRGETWDILFSEVKSNGSGWFYKVGTRIYFDILPTYDMDSFNTIFFDSLDYACSEGIQNSTGITIDNSARCYGWVDGITTGTIVTLADTYQSQEDYNYVLKTDVTIKSGGYWRYSNDYVTDNGDEFYGIVSSGNGGSISIDPAKTFGLEPTFTDTVSDSGYYAATADATDKSGVVSFTSVFNNIATDYKACSFDSSKDKFGIAMFRVNDIEAFDKEEIELDITATDFTELKTDDGIFYTFVTDIPESEFDTALYALPFATIAGKTFWGKMSSAKVNGEDGSAKWLGLGEK